jgi:hypothetical protein
MKPETAIVTMLMAVFGLAVVVLGAGMLEGPATSAAAPAPRARPQANPPQPVVAATRGPLQATPAADLSEEARARDAQRLTELQAIAVALRSYYEDRKSYPSTSNQLQTGCVYQNADRLCALRGAVGLDTLTDARGGNDFGYWYISDGQTYTLIASLEGAAEGGDTCPEAASLLRKPNIFCLRSHQ